jgi:hypothetical protein
MSQTQPTNGASEMKRFELLYDQDIDFSGWYTSEKAFLAAIKKRFFATEAGYAEWIANGGFEVVEC